MADQDGRSEVWRKSTASTQQDCVEVRFLPGATQVRNSRNRGAPVLTFPVAEWVHFLAAVRGGEFER
jgi:hypothetical protein